MTTTNLHPDDVAVVAILRERRLVDGPTLDRIVAEAEQNGGRRVGALLVERGVVGRHELRAIENEIREEAGGDFSGSANDVITGFKRVAGGAATGAPPPRRPEPSTTTSPADVPRSANKEISKPPSSKMELEETAYGESPTVSGASPPHGAMLDVTDPGQTGWGFRTLPQVGFDKPLRVGGPNDAADAEVDSWMTDPRSRDARYVVGHEIGRGGMGRVVEAYDRDLCRKVALKVVRETVPEGEVVARFVEEAQATGQIEHPNIVPIYDIGITPEGQVFYVMKLVRGRTLRQVLAAVKHKIGEARREFGRVRLLSIFQQVCMGIDFAHAKGVVHRDLKPDNIMIGDYGEVLVMDWGLAKILGREFSPDAITQVQTPRSRAAAVRDTGGSKSNERTLSGTPLYMSPEQARGDASAIDERSDIYSLGAILYEILTFSQPFHGEDIGEVLDQVLSAPVERPNERAARNGAEHVPEDLEVVCLRALEKEKAKRYARAREMHDEIADFLEGTRIRERNRREAEARVDAGQRFARRYFALRRVEARLTTKAERIARGTPASAPAETKRPLWRTEDLVRAAGARAAAFLAGALDQYTQALGFEPANDAARLGSAELYWDRFLAAERVADREEAIYYESLVKRFGGDEFRDRLRGTGSIQIATEPARARVFLAPFVERDRRLSAGDMRDLGETPVPPTPAEMGSYLVIVTAPNGTVVRVPVVVGRLERVSMFVRIPRPGDVAPGFTVIPEGRFQAGGDPLAFNPAPPSPVVVGEFAIAKHPVTCGEYVEFLNDLCGSAPEEAERRVPRRQPTSGAYWKRDANGRYVLPEQDDEGERWLPDWPVIAVSWEDATAFAEWRSRRDDARGRRFRLPTPHEWEKAGRGVDGRLFPWGNHFDPTFCHMTNTFTERPQVRPVGSIATDESPYGVRDMAGCIREFCDGWHDEAMGLRSLKGGYWGGSENIARLASRGYRRSHEVVADAGFRLAHDLPHG